MGKEQDKRRVEECMIPSNRLENLDEFQTAKLLGVSVHKLRRDRWAGGGCPFLKMIGSVRYRREDLDRYMESRIRRSTSDLGKDAV